MKIRQPMNYESAMYKFSDSLTVLIEMINVG